MEFYIKKIKNHNNKLISIPEEIKGIAGYTLFCFLKINKNPRPKKAPIIINNAGINPGILNND